MAGKSRGSVVRVSDHALVKFLQRAGGFEIEALRAGIEGSLKRAMTAAADVGAGSLTIEADGLRYVIRNNIVVTILPARRKRSDVVR